MPQLSSNTWLATLRLTPFLITVILCASITVLGLGIACAREVYLAPIDESLWSNTQDHRWSVAWHVFFFTTMPFISMLHSGIDLCLFLTAHLRPVYAIVILPVLIVGWIMQLVYWFQCDLQPMLDQCEQFYIVHTARLSMTPELVGVSTNLTYARVAFGFVIVTLYVIYLSFAAIAKYRQRAERKDRQQQRELEKHHGRAVIGVRTDRFY